MKLTNRDIEILPIPAIKTRAVHERDVLRTFYPPTASGQKNGQRRLRAYCETGLWFRETPLVKSGRGVQLLCAGGPDEPMPDCRALSRRCRSTWERLPTRKQVIYTATRRTRLLFGGTERHRLHALPALSHDAQVASVYCHLVRSEPELAEAWRSEDDQLLPAGFGQAQPDAVLVDADEQPVIAIEFAGDYSAERFERLFATFAEQHLGYRIYGAER